MRTLGGRRLVAPAALAALLAAVLAVPGTATADESDGTYELVVANISTADAQANAAWVGQRIATASVSPTTWSAGDTVTVTVTYEHADDAPLCGPRDGLGSYVRIRWDFGGDAIDFSPPYETPPFRPGDITGDRFNDWNFGYSWDAPGIGSTGVNEGAGLASGSTFSVTYRAIEDWALNGRFPQVQVIGVGLYPDVCDPESGSPLHSAPGFNMFTGTRTLRTTGGNTAPVADFVAEPKDDDPSTIDFTNRSRDAETPFDSLTFDWEFGDGSGISVLPHPTYHYERPGTYQVALTVTDGGGRTNRTVREVVVPSDLVVNSTGDAPAADPDEGCDTGDTVGTATECTLRAAIEAATAQGGGTITFDIDDDPVIRLGSALPVIAVPVTIDGTTQADGWVEVSGGGEHTLAIGNGSLVTGLAVHGGETALIVGSDSRVEGNRIGMDRAGNPTGDTRVGVGVLRGGAVVAANEVVAEIAVQTDAEAAAGVPVQVIGNRLGIDRAGLLVDDVEAGVVTFAPTQIVDNTIAGSAAGVLVLGAGAAGTVVQGNLVGTDGSGLAGSSGWGVLIEGAPRVEVRDNHVAATVYAPIGIAGSDQTINDGDGRITLHSPYEEPLERSVTGGSAVVTGNTVGVAGHDPGEQAEQGILAWADAGNLHLEDNTVVVARVFGIGITGGVGHRVVGNRIGTAASPVVGTGVELAAGSITVTGNTVHTRATGIGQVEDSGPLAATVSGNMVTGHDDEAEGIVLGALAAGSVISANSVFGAGGGGLMLGGEDLVVDQNTVVDSGPAIVLSGDGGVVSGNTVRDSGDAIDVTGDGAQVRDNTVLRSGHGVMVRGTDARVRNTIVEDSGDAVTVVGDRAAVTANVVVESDGGITVSGQKVVVSENLVGLRTASGVVLGSAGDGIRVVGGDAAVSRNALAGIEGDGVVVGSGAKARLTANRIWRVDGAPIVNPIGPTAPRLAAAMTADTASPLTTLVVTGLPVGETGQLEVFANDACDAPGGQAQHVLAATRTVRDGEEVRIVQLAGSRDHFTLTYTDAEQNTSELSACGSRTNPPDSDGDGAPDPLDELLGLDQDPTKAVIATRNEQLLLAAVAGHDVENDFGGGRFEQLGVVDDPAPGGHPEGWSLPYGAISFQITDVIPGIRTMVSLASFHGTDPLLGTSYWKYGPQSSGAGAGWYAFDWDEQTGTGARMTTADFSGLGIRPVYTLVLGDGMRGDNDGTANGTIVDPGGPVIFDGAVPEAPTMPAGTAVTPPAPASALPATGVGGTSTLAVLAVLGLLAGAALLWFREVA